MRSGAQGLFSPPIKLTDSAAPRVAGNNSKITLIEETVERDLGRLPTAVQRTAAGGNLYRRAAARFTALSPCTGFVPSHRFAEGKKRAPLFATRCPTLLRPPALRRFPTRSACPRETHGSKAFRHWRLLRSGVFSEPAEIKTARREQQHASEPSFEASPPTSQARTLG